MKLTKSAITSLKGTGTRYDVVDSEPGLRLRVSGDGSIKTWTVLTRVGVGRASKRVRLTLGSIADLTLAEAREAAQVAKRRARTTGTPQPELAPARAEAATETFGALVDRYLDVQVPALKPSTQREHRRRIERHLRPVWSRRAAGSIRYSDVAAITQPLVAATPVEARRVHALISAIYAWALLTDARGVDVNPCAGRPKPGRAEPPRERTLDDGELRHLVLAARRHGRDPSGGFHDTHWQPEHRAAAALAHLELLLGQRGVELQSMRWADLTDEADGVLWTSPAAGTKTSDQHRVPGSVQAGAILDERGLTDARRRAHPVYVFPGRRGDGPIVSPHKAIRALYRVAGVEDAWRHDLRRTLATRLGAAGTPPEVIGRVLNHRPAGSNRVTAIYNTYQYLPEMRAALQGWADALDRVVGVRTLARRA